MNVAGLVEAVRALGLVAPDEDAGCVPLAGGVSSDVFLLTTTFERALVVKRMIPKLRVTADWRAPVTRDAQEAAWLETVHEIDPRLTPKVLARWPEKHLIVLEWRDGDVWKQTLAAGRIDLAFAGGVGRALAHIHAATAGRADIAACFPDRSNFRALRIDPFIRFTASRHPDVANRLKDIATDLEARQTALIWGDASPKNILVGADGPVFLDAETAAMGDPAFDLAFCLTHLLLKTVWLAPGAPALIASFEALRDGYQTACEADDGFGRRTTALIGALLLARVDGKSPAGYLDADQDDIVRHRAKAILVRGELDLGDLPAFWRSLS